MIKRCDFMQNNQKQEEVEIFCLGIANSIDGVAIFEVWVYDGEKWAAGIDYANVGEEIGSTLTVYKNGIGKSTQSLPTKWQFVSIGFSGQHVKIKNMNSNKIFERSIVDDVKFIKSRRKEGIYVIAPDLRNKKSK